MIKRSVVTLVLLSGSIQANADFYYGVTLGLSSFEEANTSELFRWTDVDTQISDNSDTAFSLLAGYKFEIGAQTVAAEFSYKDFGENVVDVTGSSQWSNIGRVQQNVTSEVQSFDFSLVHWKPLSNNFSFNGRIGISVWDDSGEFKSTSFGPIPDNSGVLITHARDNPNDGVDIFFGFGLTYSRVFIEYGRYTIADSDVDSFAVGIRF